MDLRKRYLDYNIRTVREWVAFNRYYDPIWQTVMNGAVRMSRVCPDVDADVCYIGFRVPEGRQFIVYFLSLTMTENFYTLTVERRVDGFDTTENSLELYKSRLYRAGEPHTVQTRAWSQVSPLGDAEILQETIVDAGLIQGPGRPSSAAQLDDVFIVFREDRVIKIQRQEGGQPFSYGIMVVAWEEDAEA